MKKSIEAGRPANTVRTTWAIVALALFLASAADATGTSDALINECNSDITVAGPMTIVEGATTNFTLTISSTDARDNANNPVAQEFSQATFVGDCMQPPGLPCTPDTGFMFLGNVGGTCPGVGVPIAAGGMVTFPFVAPDLSLLIPAPMTPVSCTITFDGVYAAAGVYAAQANTSGVCQNPGFPPGSVTSDTTVTSALTVTMNDVPTMGEVALGILTLTLLTGSWLILRRRNASSSGTAI